MSNIKMHVPEPFCTDTVVAALASLSESPVAEELIPRETDRTRLLVDVVRGMGGKLTAEEEDTQKGKIYGC